MPSQAATYRFQQQHMPRVLPNPPNFIIPFQRQWEGQGQLGRHLSPRRGGNTQHQQHAPGNLNQGLSRYMITGGNVTDPPVVPQGPTGHLTFDILATPTTSSASQHSGPVSMSTLALALASATPENQQIMLREQLYLLGERLEHNHAGKITEMLLEMDQTEVLHLIESPDALSKKVAEALDVLRSAPGSNIGDNLGSLS